MEGVYAIGAGGSLIYVKRREAQLLTVGPFTSWLAALMAARCARLVGVLVMADCAHSGPPAPFRLAAPCDSGSLMTVGRAGDSRDALAMVGRPVVATALVVAGPRP